MEKQAGQEVEDTAILSYVGNYIIIWLRHLDTNQSRREEAGWGLHKNADDIVLLSKEIEQARKLVASVQVECRKEGLELNAKKTQAMFYNTDVAEIWTVDGTLIKKALTESKDQDFKYLGSWCEQSRDISTRKATSETKLLYGSATWTITKAGEKKAR